MFGGTGWPILPIFLNSDSVWISSNCCDDMVLNKSAIFFGFSKIFFVVAKIPVVTDYNLESRILLYLFTFYSHNFCGRWAVLKIMITRWKSKSL